MPGSLAAWLSWITQFVSQASFFSEADFASITHHANEFSSARPAHLGEIGNLSWLRTRSRARTRPPALAPPRRPPWRTTRPSTSACRTSAPPPASASSSRISSPPSPPPSAASSTTTAAAGTTVSRGLRSHQRGLRAPSGRTIFFIRFAVGIIYGASVLLDFLTNFDTRLRSIAKEF